MNLSDSRAAEDALFTERVRSLLESRQKEYAELVNWGVWCRDDPQRPQGIRPPKVWDQVKHDETEEWGDKDDAEVVAESDEPAKAEAREKKHYNAARAAQLDERMHGPGGLPDYIRLVLRVVFVYQSHEAQYVREARSLEWRWQVENAGCTQDALLERLAEGLKFVGRFT